jgi:hypothetical protein
MISPSEAKTRKQQRDHERYMRHRSERLERQRMYYREHREQVIESVKACQRRRVEKLRALLMHKNE